MCVGTAKIRIFFFNPNQALKIVELITFIELVSKEYGQDLKGFVHKLKPIS
jgi:hypothetical protein